MLQCYIYIYIINSYVSFPFIYTYICMKDFSQLRICRPPLPLSFAPIFCDSCALCWIEWKIDFPIFIFWVMADCISNLRVTHRDFQVCHQPTEHFFDHQPFKSGQIYRILQSILSQNLNFFVEKQRNFIYLFPLILPPLQRDCSSHVFGFRTLASLVSVWIRCEKISSVFCIH